MAHTKSKNGCASCRSRRIKCDESKPECVHCRVKGLVCPGYKKQELAWRSWDPPRSKSRRVERSPDAVPRSGAESQESQVAKPSDLGLRKAATSTSLSLSTTRLADDKHLAQSQIQPVPLLLRDDVTRLVDFYFDRICVQISTFDGIKNPFRTTLSRNWHRSSLLSSCIQSVAAVRLVDDGSVPAEEATRLLREAFRQLRQTLAGDGIMRKSTRDEVMLGLLLVGPTVPWQSPGDHGYVHYRMAVSLLKHDTSQNTPRPQIAVADTRGYRFFAECLICWWVSLCFVTGEQLTPPPPLDFSQDDALTLRHPHPWTGVSPEIRLIFGRVLRLVFLQRHRLKNCLFVSNRQAQAMIEDMAEAAALEQELLAFQTPDISCIADSGDPTIPKEDFIIVANCFQWATILLLYRVFPDLLDLRLGLNIHDDGIDTRDPSHNENAAERQEWLSSAAIHALHLLDDTHSAHTLRSLQPVLLLALGGEMAHSAKNGNNNTSVTAATDIAGLSEYLSSFQEVDLAEPTHDQDAQNRRVVEEARRRILDELHNTKNALGKEAQSTIIKILEETWRRLDTNHERSFWIDIMIERGWVGVFS